MSTDECPHNMCEHTLDEHYGQWPEPVFCKSYGCKCGIFEVDEKTWKRLTENLALDFCYCKHQRNDHNHAGVMWTGPCQRCDCRKFILTDPTSPLITDNPRDNV